MSVRTTALLTMVGLAGTFVIRTANSVAPALYDSLLVARIVAVLLLVASLFYLSFFWSVQTAWAGGGRSRLEGASRLATVGAALAVLLRLRLWLGVLGESRGIAPASMEGMAAFVQVISVLALLWFFYVVHVELRHSVVGTGGALLGAALFAFAALITLLLHVLPQPPAWLAERSWFVVVLSIPLGLVAVVGLLRFLAAVRRDPRALVGTPASRST
jgi:hypothetical protein